MVRPKLPGLNRVHFKDQKEYDKYYRITQERMEDKRAHEDYQESIIIGDCADDWGGV